MTNGLNTDTTKAQTQHTEVLVTLAEIKRDLKYVINTGDQLQNALEEIKEKTTDNALQIAITKVKSERALWTAVFSALGAMAVLAMKVFM